MPDAFGFNHLLNWGVVSHSCIECDWPLPEVRALTERQRMRHHEQHEQRRREDAERRKREGLKKARRVKAQTSAENERIEERYG